MSDVKTVDQPKTEATGATEAATPAIAERTERLLANGFTLGLPIVTLLGAIVVGVVSSIGPAVLVAAGGALLGVVALFWGSLRTLSGEAPLAPELLEAATMRRAASEHAENKRRAVRALKDLEHEHAVGKVDDKDYAILSQELRAQAKTAMKELDADVAPYRAKAEDLLRKHLKKRGLVTGGADESDAKPTSEPTAAVASTTPPARLVCPGCGASNEHDATFCKKCGAALQSKEVRDAQA